MCDVYSAARRFDWRTPMNKKQLAHLEKRLLEERKRIMKRLARFGESVSGLLDGSDPDLPSHPFHMADCGTDSMEREQAFLMASNEARFLYHIDQALRRLYQTPDKYGVCEECGGAIGFERLDALPHARLCIRCKEREEDATSAWTSVG
jgi:RNA polymerase-binding protein DksA